MLLFELWHVVFVCLNTRLYHKRSSESRKISKFWCQITLCSFGIYCRNATLPLYNTITSSTASCTVGLFSSQNLLFSVSKIFRIFQSLSYSGSSWFGGYSLFQNEGIEERRRSDRVPLRLNKMECSTAHLWTNNLLGSDAGHASFEFQVQKCVHSFDGKIRWLCWSASCRSS